MTHTNPIQNAVFLGAAAYASGKAAAPHCDAAFIATLPEEHAERIELYKAWGRGWVEACAAAPVELED